MSPSPSQESCNTDHSSHETFYGNYTNYGYHLSEGTMNFNHCQVNISNPVDHTHERSLKQPKRRLTDSGASADPIQSKRQRVGDFVKITLDTAKECADFGYPLKAALAGVSALVERYEGFEVVKYKVESLQSQLDRLKPNNTTTTVDQDPEKARRQTELISALGEVEKRSQELLERGRATQFVDKERDAGEVARLVEQFQEAITHYRISQQQAIYDGITSLSSSFNTLLKLQESSSAVKNKLDSVMGRLDQLCSAEDSDEDNEHGRWAKLFNTLGVIRDNGNVLYNRINAQGYKESEDDIQAASGIVEDIRDALLEYQVSQQRAIYDQNCKSIDPVDLAALNNRRARGAAYQHGNRRGCLRGTREVVLNEIESWTKDFDKSPVFWLNGLAGTGKSTIAQTIAERAFADGLLGASFFCSQDSEDLSDLRFIFPTLAFQLAHKFPGFRAHLVPILRSNQDIVYESLYNQMERLIVEPLRSAAVSTVIVVDALDECKDDKPSSAILFVLGQLVEQIPRVKFFITGRPEPRIKNGFYLPLKDATKVFVLHDVHPDSINNDILLFLRHELSELARQHQLEGWPSDEHISLLCQRAAGLFVYAVATVKFLSKTHLPDRRLDVIVNLPQCTIPEGKTEVKPRTTLDSLYMSVLDTAFNEEDPEVVSKLQSIIGAVVLLVNPLPPSGIAELTNLNPRGVKRLLMSVQSLLILDEDPTQPVKSFHKSFPDFVTDPSRCIDKRFYISPGNLHLQLAISCLRVLNNGLEQNLLSLPDYALNSEVKDLQTRIDGRISVALRYACQSWHNHLSMSRGDVTDVISRIRIFLEEKFLAWLEVLSVLKATRGAVVALEKLMAWLQEVSADDQLVDTARDCFYFVTKFFEPINVSATHIYHSALELSPLSSIIRKLHYHRRFARFPRVEIGIQDSWDPFIAIPTDDSRECWSPCGQFIAIQTKDAVKIRDAQTFEVVSTFQFQFASPGTPQLAPSYSPDGRFLACYNDDPSGSNIIIWDIQTGGVVKKLMVDFPKACTWSPEGGVVVTLSHFGGVDMYDVASGTTITSSFTWHIFRSDYSYIWTHNKSMRVMVQDKTTTIYVFEIGPARALTKIGSFSIQLENYHIKSFSPTTHRISVSVSDSGNPPHHQLVILDIRNSGRLLVEKGFSHSHSFSSDGRCFAASLSDSFHIWNYDGSHYIPWRQFPFSSHRGLFSPTLPLILVDCSSTLRLLRLDTPSIAPLAATRIPQLDIFRSGAHIATAHYQGKTITITNPVSQIPSQFIDTDFKISGLGVTGSVLIVRGPKVVVAWPLTEEGWVRNTLGNRRASRGDSIWSISPSPHCEPKFSVEGETGIIKSGKTLHIYNSKTGEILEPIQELPRYSGPWYSFNDNSQARCNTSVQKAPPKDNRKPSFVKEWLKDHQGKCLLWQPIEWQLNPRRNIEWYRDISTLKFKFRDETPIIIKLH